MLSSKFKQRAFVVVICLSFASIEGFAKPPCCCVVGQDNSVSNSSNQQEPASPATPYPQNEIDKQSTDSSNQTENDGGRNGLGPSEFDEFGMIPTARAIKMMELRMEQNSADFVSMAILGQLLIRDAKERDDHQSYVTAEKVLRKAIKINPEGAKAAQVHLITALQSQHKFKEALAQSEIALKVLPGNLVAIASQGDALLELGKIDEAEERFTQVVDKVQTPGTLARVARLAELKGRTGESIQLLEEARQKSIAAGERDVTTAWYDFRLGMLYFGSGQLDQAEQAYQTGIARKADDTRSLNGLAEVMIARGKLAEAEALYRKSLNLEKAPPAMADFGDLLQKMGKTEEAKKFWDQADALMQEEAATTGVAHYRERAMFLLNHDRNLQLALNLAQMDFQQRQDIYSHDTLAWALYKNGKLKEALEHSNKALGAGANDAELYFRTGMVAADAGEKQEAIRRLGKSLSLNSQFDPLAAEIAKEKLKQLKSKTHSAEVQN